MVPAIDLHQLRSQVEQIFPVLAKALAEYSGEIVAAGTKPAIKEAALHLAKSVNISVFADVNLSTGQVCLSHRISAGHGEGRTVSLGQPSEACSNGRA